MREFGVHRAAGATAIVTLLLALPVQGQAQLPRTPGQAGDTVLVTPGARYAAGGFRSFLLGSHYRDLWTTSIQVPVLDLRAFGRGLTPDRSHVGSQTTSLRFLGGDGRTYQFRSVFKTPAARLRADLQGTVVAEVLQDGASASHPVGAAIVGPLLERAQVLYSPPSLFVMPDDPALGEYRADFAGLLGWVEERPDEADDEGQGGFGVALRVISPERLFERIDDGPRDQVDVGTFLRARLVDILIGDRDRHRDNWRWALLADTEPVRWWVPISRDHDEAFVKLDGLALTVAKRYYPQLTSFAPDYDRSLNLNWHSREIDRRFLAGVDRAVWDSTAHWLQGRLSDEVIEDAVRRMPPPMYARGGPSLEQALKERRDALPEEVGRYYRILSREVEVHATNAPERAEIERIDDRYLDVRIRAEGFDEPWFVRRFDDHDTHEVRIAMWGGRDRVVIRGDGDPDIQIRVIGGSGRDALVDSSRVGGATLYDSGDETEFGRGPATRVDRRSYPEWIGSDTVRYPPRDWGSWTRPWPVLGAGPDFGALVGLGFQRTTYGFRKDPFASDFTMRAGYATGDGWGLVELKGEVHPENEARFWEIEARASGIDILRHYGLGNDTRADEATNFYKVEVNEGSAEVRLVQPLGTRATLRLGPFLQYTTTTADDGPRLFTQVEDTLYGAGTFLEVGGHGRLELDLMDGGGEAGSRASVVLDGRYLPAVADVLSGFGTVSAEVQTVLAASNPDRRLPSLGVRAGTRATRGRYPFHEAAYLGGRDNLRGWTSDRFAGDAAVYGNLEVRQPLGHFDLILPAEIGVFGIADAGRVYVDGKSPGGWHTGVGGGVWFAFLDRANAVSLSIVRGAERTGFYAGLGFGVDP